MLIMFLKVELDQEECTGCGACYEDECPEVFEEEEGTGLSRIVSKYRIGEPGEGAVPLEMRACVEAAASKCPTDAIRFFELDEIPEDKAVGY